MPFGAHKQAFLVRSISFLSLSSLFQEYIELHRFKTMWTKKHFTNKQISCLLNWKRARARVVEMCAVQIFMLWLRCWVCIFPYYDNLVQRTSYPLIFYIVVVSYFFTGLHHSLFSFVYVGACVCVCQFECVLFNFKNSATLLPEQHRFNSEPTLQQTHYIDWIDRLSPLYGIEHNIHFLT